MWFPCLHHILELIFASYIKVLWKSSGPCDPIYTKFQKAWPKIVENMPEVLEQAKHTVEFLSPQHNITQTLYAKISSKM